MSRRRVTDSRYANRDQPETVPILVRPRSRFILFFIPVITDSGLPSLNEELFPMFLLNGANEKFYYQFRCTSPINC